MASPNIVMRDPVMYRILHEEHPRTGGEWCIYPMYDWAHGQSDWIEGVTHSLCDTSFEIHRPLYEWFIERIAEAGAFPEGVTTKSRQIEFARGNITYMITSKRKLHQLITNNIVSGWDDPRMPSIRGMRRRGFLPRSIVRFWNEVGVQKRENNIEIAKLENIVRDDLNKVAERRMAVLDPLKVVITNFDEGVTEEFDAVNNPEDESAGTRMVGFTREIYIERSDFMEDPPKKFFRLAPGREVRLRYAYLITCQEAIKDPATGEILELHCTYDPETRGGSTPDGRKVRGTLHWVSASHALPAEVRLYEHLFLKENPSDVGAGQDFLATLNPDSLKTLETCYVEATLKGAPIGSRYQFLRHGYFCIDPHSSADRLVFNRTVSLRDTWAKIAKT